jgi:hypothetical protein
MVLVERACQMGVGTTPTKDKIEVDLAPDLAPGK